MKEDFGNTQTREGFARLIEFIKREHERKKKSQDPEFQTRVAKLERYRQQKTETPDHPLKKGAQIKKSA